MQGAEYLVSILAWYKASGIRLGGLGTQHLTNGPIPRYPSNITILTPSTLLHVLQRLRQLIRANKGINICQIS